MKPKPEPTALKAPCLPSISEMREAVKDVRRQAEAAPQAEDFAREAGAEVKHNPDGTWVATVRGMDNIRRAVRMQDGARKIEIERGQKLDASRPKETLVDGDGRTLAAPVHLAEQIAKKRGMRARPNWGRPKMRWAARNGELVRVF